MFYVIYKGSQLTKLSVLHWTKCLVVFLPAVLSSSTGKVDFAVHPFRASTVNTSCALESMYSTYPLSWNCWPCVNIILLLLLLQWADRIITTPGKTLGYISFILTFWVQILPSSTLLFVFSGSINLVPVKHWHCCDWLVFLPKNFRLYAF